MDLGKYDEMCEATRKKTVPENGQDLLIKIGDKTEILTESLKSTVWILPAELWEQIFKKVENPKDLLSCWNTTSAWATALRSTDFYFKMTLPFILPYLNWKDLLECSSVSKSWNTSVDACIQIAEDFDNDSRLTQKQRIVLELDSTQLIDFLDEFTLSFGNKSGEKVFVAAANPVAFRRVRIRIWRDVRDEDVPHGPHPLNHDPLSLARENLLQFLGHHGHLIKNLHLSFDDEEDVSSLEKIQLVQSCLMRTPNLCIFYVSSQSFHGGDRNPNQDEVLEAFSAYISENPWPSLPLLKALKFGEYNCTNRPEFASLANSYAPQLVYFQLGFSLADQADPLRLLPARFSRLQKIRFLLPDRTRSAVAVQFRTLVQTSQCPLRHLTVVFCDEPDLPNHLGLMAAINAAGATLETLVFRPKHAEFIRYNSQIMMFDEMRLPVLKRLTLDTYGYPPVEFLRSVCPALQHLTLRPALVPDYSGEWLKLCHEDIYMNLYFEHQFWNQLADIQTVDVQFVLKSEYLVNGEEVARRKVRKLYTRTEYKAQLAQAQPHLNIK